MNPYWHDGALSDLAPAGDRPVVWSVAAGGTAAARAIAGVPARTDDLADAARTADGGWRLLRRRLARALIAHLAGVGADAVRLARTGAGAPSVEAPDGWHIGLSARGGDCLIGAARRPIAVDREPLDDAAPLWDMLAPGEVRAIRALPPADRAGDWLRRWTIKEAHAKLIGDPRRIAPDTIETRIESAAEATATFEGRSRCWTRRTPAAIETVAVWA